MVLNQNFIRIEVKMKELCIIMFTWVNYSCTRVKATLTRPVLAIIELLYCNAVNLAKGFKNVLSIPKVLGDKPVLEFYYYLN